MGLVRGRNRRLLTLLLVSTLLMMLRGELGGLVGGVLTRVAVLRTVLLDRSWNFVRAVGMFVSLVRWVACRVVMLVGMGVTVLERSTVVRNRFVDVGDVSSVSIDLLFVDRFVTAMPLGLLLNVVTPCRI